MSKHNYTYAEVVQNVDHLLAAMGTLGEFFRSRPNQPMPLDVMEALGEVADFFGVSAADLKADYSAASSITVSSA